MNNPTKRKQVKDIQHLSPKEGSPHGQMPESMKEAMKKMGANMDPEKAMEMAKSMGASPEALKKMEAE